MYFTYRSKYHLLSCVQLFAAPETVAHPGSSVHGILQASILEWLAIPFSKSESESQSIMSKSLQPHGLYSPWNSPGHHTGVGSLSLLQGIFPTQRSNPGLLHCRHVLYQLSYHCSQRMPQYQGDSGQKVLVPATLFRSTPLLCQTRISILSTDFQSGGHYN